MNRNNELNIQLINLRQDNFWKACWI